MIATLTPEHRVKARKPHRCDWCGKLIEAYQATWESWKEDDRKCQSTS